MGLFDFLKKIGTGTEGETSILSGKGLIGFIASNLENPSPKNVSKALDALATPSADLDHLTKDGELPWGWHTHTKEFTTKINHEYSYFLNLWLEARGKSPQEHYAALKSFVQYLVDAEKLCDSKGECFSFWYRNILTSDGYVDRRKKELEDLAASIGKL